MEKFPGVVPNFESFGAGVIEFIVEDGEKLKNVKNYQKIMSILLKNEVERDSLLGYIGGGSVGDISGFVASTYKRGMNLLAIPTTLLSQVDSSIGGKNAINYGGVKNAIGTFYNPSTVIMDLNFISRAEVSMLRDGISEMIKYGIIHNQAIISVLNGVEDISSFSDITFLRRIIAQSVKAKAEVIGNDYYDSMGSRIKLNFGHTVGHAIESASRNSISHGKAIATGMLVESIISRKIGLCSKDIYENILALMNKFGINPVDTAAYGKEELLKYIRNDKKISGSSLHMPLPIEIGKMDNASVDMSIVGQAIDEFHLTLI